MPQLTASLLALSGAWTGHAWLLRNVLMAMLLARLLQMRLVHRYPILAFYLLLSIVRSAALTTAPVRTTLYGGIYLATEPLIWISYAAICWEIYGLVFEKYKGLSVLTRRTLVVVLGVAFAISLYAASHYMSHAWDVYPLIHFAGTSSRTVVGTFLLFLTALLAFMLWFRMVVSRNIIVYAVSFSLFFVGVGLGVFLFGSAGPAGSPVANFLMLATIDLVLGVWVLAFRRAGEDAPSRMGPRPSPVQERELLQTLDSLNRLAASASRRN